MTKEGVKFYKMEKRKKSVEHELCVKENKGQKYELSSWPYANDKVVFTRNKKFSKKHFAILKLYYTFVEKARFVCIKMN